MIEYHQQKKTESGEYIVSHSNLCKLDPAIGGHPKLFYKSLNATFDEDKTPSMEKGDLLHEWIEKKDQFIISDQNKPGPQVAALVEAFHKLYYKGEWLNNQVFLNVLQQDWRLDMEASIKYKEVFILLPPLPEITENSTPSDKLVHAGMSRSPEQQFILFVQCVRFARIEVDYNAKKLEATVAKDFGEALPYLNFIHEANGKIILDKNTKNILVNCYESLKAHPFASKLLFDMEGEHEKEYFWLKDIELINDSSIMFPLRRKAKLDKLIVDEFNKKLIIPDLKTTAYPIATFADAHPFSPYNKYKYGRQLVNYASAFFANNRQYNEAEWDIQLYNIVVQTTDDIFPTMVYRTPIPAYYNYKRQLSGLETLAAYHIANNKWNLTVTEEVNENAEYITIDDHRDKW